MKNRILLLLLVLPLMLRAQVKPDQEWLDSKFSMFIHFGLYSELGGVWNGQPVTSGYSEQIQSFAGIFSDWYAETAATPLALMKEAIHGNADALAKLPDNLDLFLGLNPGCVGEVSAVALLIGLVYMLVKKIITWHIPVSILATVFVFSGIMHLVNPTVYASPLVHLCTGGVMLGAIFMATDYVTSPMTHKGMIIYGIAIGFLTVVIRLFGAYPEGMSFAILIMNAFTPLINTYCKPKRFGEVVKK